MPITYQWRRDTGSGPVNIPDTPPGTSTNATYTLVSADEGATIDCVVTASNGIGSDATVIVTAPQLIAPGLVTADADATLDLTGDADAEISRVPASADATADLTGDSEASVIANATASSTAELTSSAVDSNINWDYSWDFSQGDPSTDSDISPLTGGVTLTRTAGSYTRLSYPSYMDPSGLDLDPNNDGPISLATNTDFGPVTAPIVNDGVGIQARLILKTGGPDTIDNRLKFAIGSSSTGARLSIEQSNLLGTPYVSRFIARIYNSSNVVATQAFVATADEQWVVLDVNMTSPNGTDSKIEIMVNGQTSSAVNSVYSLPALTGDSILFDNSRGGILFAGVRQSNTPITQSQHEDAINAVFDDVIIGGRTWDAAWAGDDATSSSWPDLVGSADLSLVASHTVSTDQTTNVSSSSVGSARINKAVVRATGTSFAMENTVASILGSSSGESVWYRIITETDNVGNSEPMYRGATTTGADRVSTDSSGVASFDHFPGPTTISSSANATQWVLIDVIVDTNGDITIYANGSSDTSSISSPNRALSGTTIQALNGTTKVLFFGFTDDISDFTDELHNHDFTLLGAGT